jgi:uncharacterized membrane protein
VVPLVFAGPFIAIGLCLGIVLLVMGGGATILVLALCGAFGLLALGRLLFRKDNLSRRQAELSGAGLLAGLVPVVWFLRSGLLQKLRAWDKGALFWTAVLIPPAIVGLRRAILLFKNLAAAPVIMDNSSD